MVVVGATDVVLVEVDDVAGTVLDVVVVVRGTEVVEVDVEVEVEVDVEVVDVEVDVVVDVVVVEGVDVVVDVDVEEVVVVGGTDVVVVLVEVEVEVDVEVDVVEVDVDVDVVEVDVEVEVVDVEVVVGGGVSGICRVRNAWSDVGAVLFDETRSWQLVQSPPGGTGFDGGSFGARQAKPPVGCRPLIGSNSRVPGDVNVAVPFASASTGALEAPLSQLIVTSQPAAVCGVPSHCSTNTGWPTLKPVATTVNDSGFPFASPGTTNGFPVGVVIVAAKAIPARPSTHAAAMTATSMSRRYPCRVWMRMRDPSLSRACCNEARTPHSHGLGAARLNRAAPPPFSRLCRIAPMQ